MAQETVLTENSHVKEEELDYGLRRCRLCGKVVPETMLCLYCGSPILFNMPKRN